MESQTSVKNKKLRSVFFNSSRVFFDRAWSEFCSVVFHAGRHHTSAKQMVTHINVAPH